MNRDRSAVVVVPTRNESATIGAIVRVLERQRRTGLIDRILVVDDSTDGTPAIAEAAGAEVVRQSDIRPDLGAVQGKGDAMWRALHVCDEDVIVFVDGDTHDPSERTTRLLIDAIDGGAAFAKATYRRPFRAGGLTSPTGGGRVTELTAKPLLRAFAPQVAHFDQPLAGEIAARGDLLRSLTFATGYAVDVALLIDAWDRARDGDVVQVDTGVRQNRHRPLHELGPMADEVARAILHRTGAAPAGMPPLHERPPVALWAPPAVEPSLA